MVNLTPELAGNTLVAMAISYVVVLAYSIYMAILARNQAKVTNQMKEVIQILKEIRDKKK